MVVKSISFLFYIAMSLMIMSCIDPILQVDLLNHTGKNIKIEQYNSPNYSYMNIKDGMSKILDVHNETIFLIGKKQYRCNINKAIGNQYQSLIQKNIIRIKLQSNFLYVIPNKYPTDISFLALQKIQPKNFPIALTLISH